MIGQAIGVAVVIALAVLIGKLANRYDKTWQTPDDEARERSQSDE